MSEKKEFVVSAKPNKETWCEEDEQEYQHVLNENEEGESYYTKYYWANNEEGALDFFHDENPISCLDDWDIDVNEMNPKGSK